MKAIRLAVIFDQQIQTGGGYQQALNAALLVNELPNGLVEPVFFTTFEENVNTLAEHGVSATSLRISNFAKARTYLRRYCLKARIIKLIKRIEPHNSFEKALLAHDIDLVYFLSPSAWARDLERLNYITTVWDFCHRDNPEFPEVRWDRQFEGPERNYRAILPRATAIFVDSDLGKTNAIRRYGIDEERIHIMPFQAAIATRKQIENQALEIDIRAKYRLDVPYVFYPAQFWAHKNHVYLLEGLKVLEHRYGLKVGAIFSGGDMGNLAYVKEYVRRLDLIGSVRFTGFVPNDVIPALYKQSIALVMPTYFGPTNLPPLEAFELGVPVLYPDKAGLRDQVADAALLMDLMNPTSMAEHLANLMNSDELREQLVHAGKERLRQFSDSNHIELLNSIIEDFRWRRMCWE